MANIPLEKYAKIKDRYCVAYYGSSSQTLLHLAAARPLVEKELPGLQLYLACADGQLPVLAGEERVIPRSEIKSWERELAHYREIDGDVKKLLEESQIPYPTELFADP